MPLPPRDCERLWSADLVLAEQGQVEQNGQRLSVGSQDDELGDTAVQRLGGLVGTLLQLNDERKKKNAQRANSEGA